MEQELKKLFSSYASASDSMKQNEFENFIKVNKIYDEEDIKEIYNEYSTSDNLSFDSFKLALKAITIKGGTEIKDIITKIVDIEEKKLKELKEMRKEIIKRQKNQKKNIKAKPEEKAKEMVKDMCILGNISKKEIIYEKKNHPEKYITIEEALSDKGKNKDNNLCLGIFAKTLEDYGISTIIEKEADNSEESNKESETTLEFLTNGMAYKNKLSLSWDYGLKRNTELQNDKSEQEKFNKELSKDISKELKTSEDNIIIVNTEQGSYYNIQIIFMSDEFNDLDSSEFKEKFKNNDTLKNLKDIQKTLIMEGCILSPNMLDPEGNRMSGWPDGEKRGGLPYYSPKGWIGFGLKVTGKYDNGNDDWLGYEGNKNEWAVAYHGVGIMKGLEKAVGNIYKGGYKIGPNQAYKDDENANQPGKKVGIGIYCSPSPKVLEQYADYGESSTVFKGKKFIMGFMMRVKPDKIRYSEKQKDYWVLNPTTDEMRPYRILIKEKKEKNPAYKYK